VLLSHLVTPVACDSSLIRTRDLHILNVHNNILAGQHTRDVHASLDCLVKCNASELVTVAIQVLLWCHLIIGQKFIKVAVNVNVIHLAAERSRFHEFTIIA
jgi:hypothetical protein